MLSIYSKNTTAQIKYDLRLGCSVKTRRIGMGGEKGDTVGQ